MINKFDGKKNVSCLFCLNRKKTDNQINGIEKKMEDKQKKLQELQAKILPAQQQGQLHVQPQSQ